MKKRLRIDGFLGWLSIPLTIGFFFLPDAYVLRSVFMDHSLDILGLIVMIKGALLRMCARGHKQKFPRWDLVTTGPYSMTRNPMYLGTFSIGAGVLLIIWPWWTLPLYAGLFYLRYNKEMVKEEAQLIGCHKENYATYCQKTPRILPSYFKIWKSKTSDIYPMEDAFGTKETLNLVIAPLVAFGVGCIQKNVVFGSFMVLHQALIFLITICIFIVLFRLFYKYH